MRVPSKKGYIEKIWDHAAGTLLASEAGCVVTDGFGRALDFSRGRLLDRNQGIVAAGQNAAELKPFFQLGAEIYQAQGNTTEVITQYENIRQVDPSDTAALSTLSGLYVATGNDPKVIEVEQQLMQLDPQNYQHPLAVAQALLRQKRNPEALAMAKQALALAPDDQKAAIQQLVTQLGG